MTFPSATGPSSCYPLDNKARQRLAIELPVSNAHADVSLPEGASVGSEWAVARPELHFETP
jgi:hypothetical protein